MPGLQTCLDASYRVNGLRAGCGSRVFAGDPLGRRTCGRRTDDYGEPRFELGCARYAQP